MRIISIAGSQSNVGKTTIASFLLKRFSNYGALKVTACAGSCPKPEPCGVCSRLNAPFAIIEDNVVIKTPHTDTALLQSSGAVKIIWLQTTEAGLNDGIKSTLGRFSGLSGIITEGNHFVKAVKPSISLLVLPAENIQFKPSALEILDKIDAVIINLHKNKPAAPNVLPAQIRKKPVYFINPKQDDWESNQIFFNYLLAIA